MAVRDWIVAGALAAAASLPATSASAAELFLGSFQNGNFSNDTGFWQMTGLHGENGDQPASVIADGSPSGGLMHSSGVTYYATDVDPFFAYLIATGDPEPTVLYQGFTLSSRALFSGSAAFLGRDELPFNDFGWVRIYAGDSDDVIFPLAADCVLAEGCVSQLFYADVAGVGDFAATPWTGFSIELGPGNYFIAAHVANGPQGDTFNPSYLAIDALRAVAVPEPATWAVLIGGFFGVGALIRRRRPALA